MSEWKEVELGEVVNFNPENIGKNFKYDRITYLDISSVGSGMVYFSDEIEIEKAPSRAKRLVKDNDTILATVRPANKSYCFINSFPDNTVVSTGFAVIRAKENLIHPKYLYYAITNESFASFLVANEQGANYPAVTPDIIGRGSILLPSLPTQQRIASILSAYDDLIENNLKRIKLLEEIAQRTYEEWFVKFRIKGVQLEVGENGLPVGWKYGTLNDIISFQNGFAFKSNKFVDIGQPVIKIKNIGNNTVDVINTDCVEEEYANTATKFKLSVGDLVIAMTGATVGKVGYIPYSKKECYLNQRVGRFVELKGMNNLHFVFSVMTQGDGLLQVLNLAGGAAQPNISGNQILSIKTVIATKEILNSFHLIANENINQILNLQNQNRLLKESRDILLPRLMSGKVGV
jgi:type I restriction enzyme S subunit